MAEGKKSFLLYCDLIHTVRHLPKDKQADLFMHILEYVNDENPVSNDLIINISFEPIKRQLKRDLVKYESIVERNKKNGKLGGRPKKPKKPSGLNGNPKNPSEPKKADNDTDIDIETIKENIVDVSELLNSFKNKIKEDGWNTWMEGFYMKYKLKDNTLSFVVDDFILNLKTSAKEPPKTLQEFKNHLRNWCNLVDPIGKLNSYKKNQPKEKGSL